MIYAKYTEVLKNLMDNEQTKPKLEKALSTYPLYEQKTPVSSGLTYIPTREELNKKILNAYKYREIGFETVGRFLDELEITMCEIMPFYNQMFQTVETMNDIEDIFGNVDVTETYEETRKTDSEGKGTSESETESASSQSSNSTDKQSSQSTMTNDDKKVKSDTPGSQLDVPAKNMDTLNYASEVEWNKNNSSSNGLSEGESSGESSGSASGTSKTTGTNESSELVKTSHTFHKKGNQGVNTYAHDMIEFRNTILNIEQQIINDERLSELFMRVF